MRILAAMALAAAMLSSCTLDPDAKRYAIVVGVQDYDTISDLTLPVDDADAVTDLCAANDYAVTRLVNAGATKADIAAAFSALVPLVDGNDTVLFYFSGHGSTRSLAVYDTDLGDPESFVTYEDLCAWFSALDSVNNVVVIDACYSGSFADQGGAVDLSPPNADWDIAEGTVVWETPDHALLLLMRWISPAPNAPFQALTASGANEVSWEDNLGSFQMYHGVFTYYFLNAINLSDPDGDGWLSLGEIASYVHYGLIAQFNRLWPAYSTLSHQTATSVDRVLFKKGTAP